ncbi:hypothetical protein OHA21_20770 [Actinoplanes sp. NBC_00393]|uniref:DUF4760 domain-containing protein n=1 Tax=Actinoplanes sp. NBC_00393 TaxID=2975953 RepID=UPI002E2437B1
MEIGALMNATAVTVSIMALAASISIGIRQVGMAREQVLAAKKMNNTHVAVELLTQECRSEHFLDSEEFVLRRLRAAHGPEAGVDGLPVDARKHITRIGLYYSSLGMMSAMGAVDHALLISSTHYRVRRCWAILEPYILQERKIRKSTYMAYFEHLATVAAESDLPALHRGLGLKSITSKSAELAAEFRDADAERAQLATPMIRSSES